LEGVRGGRRRLPLRAEAHDDRRGLGRGCRRCAEAGEPPGERTVHHGRRSGLTRRSEDQRGRNARPDRVARISGGRAGDRRPRYLLELRRPPGRRRRVHEAVARSSARLARSRRSWSSASRGSSATSPSTRSAKVRTTSVAAASRRRSPTAKSSSTSPAYPGAKTSRVRKSRTRGLPSPQMPPREERAIRNEALFREVNVHIADLEERVRTSGELLPL